MPYEIKEESGEFCVYEKDGKKVKCYPTKKEAEDHMAALYANVEDTEKAIKPYDNSLKAISRTDTELVVGNYMILFGGNDLTGIGTKLQDKRIASPMFYKKNDDGSIGERFTPATNFESDYTFKGVLDVNWEHGQEELAADNVLGYVDWRNKAIDKNGIFVKRVLNRRNQYVKLLEELIDAGLIGNSTEADPALTERKADGEIVRWGLKRDTLTVTPFEPRMLTQNALAAMKALKIQIAPQAEAEAAGNAAPQAASGANSSNSQSKSEVKQMDEKEIKALVDAAVKPLTDANAAQAEQIKTLQTALDEAKKKTEVIETALKAEPPKGTGVQVNPNQKYPYKSFVRDTRGTVVDATGYGEFLQDVMAGCAPSPSVSPRLAAVTDMATKSMKAASGLNVAIPSQGGFFVQTDHNAELVREMITGGQVLSGVRRIPLGAGADSVTFNGVDETSRASTIWGGILAYWVQEATAATASKPKFREIKLETKGLAALYYATDKLLKLAPALGAEVSQGFREAMTFKVEDAIINGTGAGKPLGLMNAGSLVSVTKESGQAATTILHDNMVKMKARLFPSSWANAVWLSNPDCSPQIDALAFGIGVAGVLSPYVTYGADGITRVLGRPVVYTEHCQTLGTTGDLILWDPASYYFIDLGAVEEASSIHVAFTTYDTCFRFIYYCDGQPKLASALTPAHGSNTLTNQVKLDTRS